MGWMRQRVRRHSVGVDPDLSRTPRIHPHPCPAPIEGAGFSRTGCVGLLFAVVFVASPAFAQTDNDLHGRLEVQDAGQFSPSDSIQASLGERAADDALANLRFTWEPTWAPGACRRTTSSASMTARTYCWRMPRAV